MRNEETCGSRAGAVLADFTGLVGQKFRFYFEGSASAEAELDSVEALPRGGGAGRAAPGRREPFSLVFRLPSEPRLDQRIYTLEHPALGRLEIFLVPVAADDRGLRLQGVFN